MSKQLKIKHIVFINIFLTGFLFSQTREYVESIHENGMPKIVTVVKESKNKIIVMTFSQTWLPFLYLYGVGGLAFLFGLFIILTLFFFNKLR